MWYLYIAKNQNGAFYTGVTNNFKQRFRDHFRGKGGHYTKYNRPVEILYKKRFNNQQQAENREQQIKRWTRAKKLALIEGNFEKLQKLSVSRN